MLQKKLNDKFLLYINREVEKSRERGKADDSGLFGSTSWSLPSHIIVFLENSIKSIDGNKLKLIPWPEFKKTIFDIIDHRIE
jgi:hypothetical protein